MAELTWHPVCGEGEIDVDDARRFELNGRVIAVFHTTAGFFATDGLCTHEQANLADGFVSGEYVECPKHNSRFHIPTGKAMRVPARKDLATHPVRIEGGRVLVGLEP
jgi:3-phenylpropionate/trans-cinnamate dioxygenase ferredoxin subunit